MNDIDPEGYTRHGGDCGCGPLYTYAGIIEPGGMAPDCPVHGDPDYYEKLDAAKGDGRCVTGDDRIHKRLTEHEEQQ